MPKLVFIPAYLDFSLTVTIALWQYVQAFLLISFRQSTNTNFGNAEFKFFFFGFRSGSVLVDYDLEFSVNDTAPTMSGDEIRAAMDSGLNATSSSASNYTMDANTTVA
uniref:Uncharacterized protein n=1 Tax=Macrostomum lignano TaxID=282301 RepID=A0A1I8IDA9_9PLAT